MGVFDESLYISPPHLSSSVVGITGSNNELSEEIISSIQKIKKVTSLPIALGFGISTPEQAKIAGKNADGVIVGSAIVKEIERHSNQDSSILVKEVVMTGEIFSIPWSDSIIGIKLLLISVIVI